MISKMNKLTMLVYHKEYEDFLVKLRDAGVVHIAEKMSGSAETPELQALLAEYSRCEKMIKRLERVSSENDSTATDSKNAILMIEKSEELFAHHEQLNQEKQSLEKDIATMSIWGNYDNALIDRLKEAGYNIGFYQVSTKGFDPEWGNLYNAIVVNTIASKSYFVTVTPRGTDFEIEAEAARLASRPLGELKKAYSDVTVNIVAVNDQLKSCAEEYLPVLRAYCKELQGRIEFSKVALDGEKVSGDKLVLLEGWVPEEDRKALETMLKNESVFYELSKPTPDDDVPIRFKNNAFFRLFEPICELYMLPKYNELDLTPFFAPFYMIFFGLCLGDMGYGLVISIASAMMLMFMKKGNSMIGYARLALTLGVSTILCGSLTGTFFGFNMYEWNIPFLDWWRDNVSFAAMNPETGKLNDPNDALFNLALILGGVQICYAMVLKIVNQIIQLGFKYSIATIGWLIIILATVAMMYIPSLPVSVLYALYAIGGGGALLYNSPGKNIFLNIGIGLWDAYNMLTGLLGDMLSYIRLFALGLSGGVLAAVFNNIAVQMSPDIPVVGSLVMVIIFLFGHCLNIFMNTIGAFVHPIRLTFVEFFKNAGYEGGGTAYKPFKR